jgi:hypothetical protein
MNESIIFATIEEARTSADPEKLARAVEKFSLLTSREIDLGFERGSYLCAMTSAHYANRLERVLASS